MFAWTAVPTPIISLAATGALSNLNTSEFYAVQHVISTQLVIPPSFGMLFVALALICAVALRMILVVSQPSMSQTLRVRDD